MEFLTDRPPDRPPDRPRFFVSSSTTDQAWCRAFIEALEQAEADVWHRARASSPRDDGDLGHAREPNDAVAEVIAEIRARPVFLMVVSPRALASPSLRAEVQAANVLWARRHLPLVVPVIAERCDVPRRWVTARCLSGPDGSGLDPREAARRVVAEPDIFQQTAPQAHACGRAAYTAGQLAEALVAFSRATLLAPEVARFWNCKGLALRRVGRHAEALVALRQALTLDPTSVAAWYNLGFVHYQQSADAGTLDLTLARALAAFEQALALDPDDSDARRMKAVVLGELGRLQDAARVVHRTTRALIAARA